MKLLPPESLGPDGGSATPKSRPGLLALMWKIWEGLLTVKVWLPVVKGDCAAVVG